MHNIAKMCTAARMVLFMVIRGIELTVTCCKQFSAPNGFYLSEYIHVFQFLSLYYNDVSVSVEYSISINNVWSISVKDFKLR